MAKRNQAVQAVQAAVQTNLPVPLIDWSVDVYQGTTKFKTSALKYAHTVQASKLASDMAKYQALAIEAAKNEMSGIKPTVTPNKPTTSKLNAFGNSKGYGDSTLKAGTSGFMIRQACIELGITQTSVTKLYIDTIDNMALICANGKRVNPANIAIEVNNYKKWLKNHNA